MRTLTLVAPAANGSVARTWNSDTRTLLTHVSSLSSCADTSKVLAWCHVCDSREQRQASAPRSKHASGGTPGRWVLRAWHSATTHHAGCREGVAHTLDGQRWHPLRTNAESPDVDKWQHGRQHGVRARYSRRLGRRAAHSAAAGRMYVLRHSPFAWTDDYLDDPGPHTWTTGPDRRRGWARSLVRGTAACPKPSTYNRWRSHRVRLALGRQRRRRRSGAAGAVGTHARRCNTRRGCTGELLRCECDTSTHTTAGSGGSTQGVRCGARTWLQPVRGPGQRSTAVWRVVNRVLPWVMCAGTRLRAGHTSLRRNPWSASLATHRDRSTRTGCRCGGGRESAADG